MTVTQGAQAGLTSEKLLHMYRQMNRIRAFEDAVVDCLNRGLVVGETHLCVGQEAVAVGTCSALRVSDYMTATHRGHGQCLAKGCEMKYMFAEIFARATGYCKGKGGSMHLAAPELGILGANGIVGGGLPMAVGAALGAHMKHQDWVVVAFFGDGSANTGSVHEAMNLGAVWKLPIIFLCENNQYGMFTPVSKSTLVPDLCVRAQGYGMPGVAVDGNDVVAVYESAQAAVERARAGEGPTFIEAKTYRQCAHYAGDVARYQTCEELERAKKNDPIARCREALMHSGVLTEDWDRRMHEEIEREVEDAVEFAANSPEPEMSEMLTDQYLPFKPIN